MEDFDRLINNLVLPNCPLQNHKNLPQIVLCMDLNCSDYKKIMCPLCFQSHNKTHKSFDIWSLIKFKFEQLYSKVSTDELSTEKSTIIDLITNLSSDIDTLIRKLEITKAELSNLKKSLSLNISYTKESLNLLQNYLKENYSIDKNKLKFSNFIQQIVSDIDLDSKNFVLASEKFDFKIHNSYLTFDKLYNSTNNLLQSFIEKKNSLYKFFDQNNKPSGIEIFKNEAIRTIQSSELDSIIFLKFPLFEESQIKLRIKKLSGWIGLGIAKYEFIKNNQFKNLYKNSKGNRGIYMLSNTSACFSDFDDYEHKKRMGFGFKENDVIKINYLKDRDELVFHKEDTDEKKILKLEKNINNDFFVFAVGINSIGDSVEII